MLYRVNLFVVGHLVSTDVTDNLRPSEMQDSAIKAVASGRADKAVVKRMNGSIVFEHPKATRHSA